MAADSKTTEPSLGEKISACFKDVFKSCYNIDQKNKTGKLLVLDYMYRDMHMHINIPLIRTCMYI